MKLSDIEKTQLKLLYANGYRYLARDEYGLCGYKERPILAISKNADVPFKNWMPEIGEGSSNCLCFMHNDEFLGVGFDCYYQITKNATLRACKQNPTQKAVAV